MILYKIFLISFWQKKTILSLFFILEKKKIFGFRNHAHRKIKIVFFKEKENHLSFVVFLYFHFFSALYPNRHLHLFRVSSATHPVTLASLVYSVNSGNNTYTDDAISFLVFQLTLSTRLLGDSR